MDERHWWLAGKIAESFLPGCDVSAVEPFISASENRALIDDFLLENGPSRLFVYQNNNSQASAKSLADSLCITDNASNCVDATTILYFLRHGTERELELGHIEREVFCGVLKGGRGKVIENIQFLLQNVYSAIIGARSGTSGEASNVVLQNQIKKLALSMSDAVITGGSVSKPVTLKKPPSRLSGVDLTSHKVTQLDDATFAQFEDLISDWINAIETNINDDDSSDRLHDQIAGPLAELERWRRRLRLLMSIAEQLKTKESKFVIFAVAASKSRLAKKWRQADSLLTDAMNDTKDKVRFLESLERHFEQFYNGTSPAALLGTVLPSLVNAIVSVESVSKFYAQQGFLGLLFTKISNQLLVVCKQYISSGTTSDITNQDKLWSCILQELTESSQRSSSSAPNELQQSGKNSTQTLKKKQQPGAQSTVTLRERLESVVALYNGYSNALYSLRNMLLSSRGNNAVANEVESSTDSSKVSRNAAVSEMPGGVSLANVRAIIHNFDLLNSRVVKLLSAIDLMKKLQSVLLGCCRLPWPTEQDFDKTISAIHQRIARQRQMQRDVERQLLDSDDVTGEDADLPDDDSSLKKSGVEAEEEPSEQDVELLRSHCDVDESTEHQTTVAETLMNYYRAITDCLETSLTTHVLLDLHGKDQGLFPEMHDEFLTAVEDIEKFIAAYIRVVFVRKMTVKQSIDLITKFAAIQQQPRLERPIIARFAKIFVEYSADLQLVQNDFEKNKSGPPLLRDIPPVAGAISWSRQLARRVKEPMMAFIKYCSPASARLCGFDDVLDLHNQIVANLLTYENALIVQWKSGLEQANAGLKTRLLVSSPSSSLQVMVNADQRILEVIREGKYLQHQLGIKIPRSAANIMQQEARFKHYRDKLQHAVSAFQTVCDNVPVAFRMLFVPHVELAFAALLPGLTVLDWTSTNIDVFVHQIHSSAKQLQTTVSQVTQQLSNDVDVSVERIASTLLFDPSVVKSSTWSLSAFEKAMTESIAKQSKCVSEDLTRISNCIYSAADSLQLKDAEENKKKGYTKERTVAILFNRYRDSICEAMKNAIVRSLLTLSSLVKVDGTLSLSERCNALLDFSDDVQKTLSAPLQFEVRARFKMPHVVLDPDIGAIQSQLKSLSNNIIESCRGVGRCCEVDVFKGLVSQLRGDERVTGAVAALGSAMEEAHEAVKQILDLVSGRYSFLWLDDARRNFTEIAVNDGPDGMLYAVVREAERLSSIEQKLVAMSQTIGIGTIRLHMQPVRETLIGLSVAWKNLYTSTLLDKAQALKDEAVSYRTSVVHKLKEDVLTLEQLNETLRLLDELRDKEGKIDQLYRPIEEMYSLLRSYEPRLSRNCCEEVDDLRDSWQGVVHMSDDVTAQLLREKRVIFEQELDKQVKAFVVEVIQFRNMFEAHGPTVPGLAPTEAASRLDDFMAQYDIYASRRQTLDSVARLFGISCKPFTELNRTGEELKLLRLLYNVYLPFLEFDTTFRNTLWSDVDLQEGEAEAKLFWKQCCSLPVKLNDVEAFQTMKQLIKKYVEVFEVLHQLAAKEMRNRHWLEVMRVTSSSFQLEAHVFKMTHIVDIGLEKHKPQIAEICRNAKYELELEIELKAIEDQWTEQAISFTSHAISEMDRETPIPLLDVDKTQQLIAKLDAAGVRLAAVLTSRYVAPHQHNAAYWAMKVKSVGCVLEQWLHVQERWLCLVEIYADAHVSKNLPSEATKFAVVDHSWRRLMHSTFELKNVLKCCALEEITQLSKMSTDLELCSKALAAYLNSRRIVFPRLHFLTDVTLLKIFSNKDHCNAVRPYLRTLFTSVVDIKAEYVAADDDVNEFGEKLSELIDSTDEPDKPVRHLLVKSVVNEIGERLALSVKVPSTVGVEQLLAAVKKAMCQTISRTICDLYSTATPNTAFEEWAHLYPGQICCMALLAVWTRDCEQGILEQRNDRSALFTVSKRYMSLLSRLQSIRGRSSWKNTGERLTSAQKLCLDSMIAITTHLHDIVETVSRRRLRDVTDYEWRRVVRLYVNQQGDEDKRLVVSIIDNSFSYGCEFLSASSLTQSFMLSERSIVSLSVSLSQCKGSIANGDELTADLIKDFASLLGQHVNVMQCTNEMDLSAVSSSIRGCAQDGCWSCFKDADRLKSASKSLLINNVECVLRALRSSLVYCYIGSQQEVSVNPDFAVFVTQTTNGGTLSNLQSVGSSWSISSDLRSSFREVSLISPDSRVVLRAHCARSGLHSPAVVAQRCKMVATLVHDQLPAEAHHIVSLQSMVAVVRHAANIKQRSRVVLPLSDLKRHQNGSKMANQLNVLSSRQTTTLTNVSVPAAKSTESVTVKHPGGPKILSAAARHEHAFIGQLMLEIIGPRFRAEHSVIFQNIVRDVFPGMPEIPVTISATAAAGGMASRTTRGATNSSVTNSLPAVVSQGIVPQKSWCQKCHQLQVVSSAHTGVIVVGPAGSGKSSIIQAIVDCNNVPSSVGRPTGSGGDDDDTKAGSQHRLCKIYPLATDDIGLVFGSYNHDSTGKWTDGMLTTAWKKAGRVPGTTWLCLDGPMTPVWSNHFITVLDDNKVLSLANGERLALPRGIRLVFETDTLSLANPAVVSRSGIVYLDKDTVGWRPLAKMWLRSRSAVESKVLSKAFDNVLDAAFQYVMNDQRLKLAKVTEVGLFTSCLSLLSAMLADNTDIGGELHVERLFLFCLIWTVGGLLDTNAREGFSLLLMKNSPAMPDDDRAICIYDYYVDEAGEWDPWSAQVPQATFDNQWDLFGNVYVDTVETIRTKMLIKFAMSCGQSVLLVGPHGAGKTALISDYLQSTDLQTTVVRRLTASRSTSASQLQQFVESNVVHRQGMVYGARNKNKLQIFIDDVNLPKPDEFGVQHCNELLRRLIGENTVCTTTTPFENRSIEGLTCIAACGSGADAVLSPRLLRHFAVLCLSEPNQETTKDIISNLLEGAILYGGSRHGLDIDLANGLVSVSCRLLNSVMQVLRPSPLPGRTHYLFTLRVVVSCFESFKRLADESCADDKFVVSLWKHEMDRIVRDQLCRYADLKWFDETVKSAVDDYWPDLTESLHQHFITFPTHIVQHPYSSYSKSDAKVAIQPVDSLDAVRNCIAAHLSGHNDKFGCVKLDICLTDGALANVIRLHRVLTLDHSSNLLLIHAVGSNDCSLVRLALHVAGLSVYSVQTSSFGVFIDGLRSAVRLAGTEGRRLVIHLTEQDLVDERYLDAVNSLLVSGEYPFLFTNDELESLLQALMPSIKRRFSNQAVDPMYYFVTCVKRNLRIVLSVSPQHWLLASTHSDYPGILNGCQVMWTCDWTKESLLDEAEYFLKTSSTSMDELNTIWEPLAQVMANIHSSMLIDCQQIPHVGKIGSELELTPCRPGVISSSDKKRETSAPVKPTTVVPNLPYSKLILLDRIKWNHRQLAGGSATGELFVGPLTYRRFRDTFVKIYRQMFQYRTEKIANMRAGLSCLEVTRDDVTQLKEQVSSEKAEFSVARKELADIERRLTAAVARLEVVRASQSTESKQSTTSSSLATFLRMNEVSSEDSRNDDNTSLLNDERDEYDNEFDRMKEATMKSREDKAKEELLEITEQIGSLAKKHAHAKEQAILWRSRVDRPCIEKVKTSNHPPVTVGRIVEMIMIMIGCRPHQNRRSSAPRPSVSRESAAAAAAAAVSSSYPSEEMSGKVSLSSGSTNVAKKGKSVKAPVQDAAASDHRQYSRQKWKEMQLIMNDANKFIDQLNAFNWQDGLNIDIAAELEGYLSKGPNGELGMSGEETQHENGGETDRSFRNQRGRSPDPGADQTAITVAAAKYSSEDAATLLQFVIAVLEYSRIYASLKAARKKKEDLEEELEDFDRKMHDKRLEEEKAKNMQQIDRDPELDTDDLAMLTKKVAELHELYEAAVVRKHTLKTRLQSMKKQLKMANWIVDRLKIHEERWEKFINENDDCKALAVDSVLAAAFLTYCGGFSADLRKQSSDLFVAICKHHGLLQPLSTFFQGTSPADFFSHSTLQEDLEERGLPHSELMLENTCLGFHHSLTSTWTLFCDTTLTVVNWLADHLKQSNPCFVKYSRDDSAELMRCLNDGLTLVVTHIDVASVIHDRIYMPVILASQKFKDNGTAFKLNINGEEVDCDPKFRMYMHTSVKPHQVPAELATHVNSVDFQPSRTDVENHLLNVFISQEKSRIYEEMTNLYKEKREVRLKLERLESEILKILGTKDIHLVHSQAAMTQLISVKEGYDDANISRDQLITSLIDLHRARDQYRSVAQRGAVCWDCTRHMHVVNSMYAASFKQFVRLFEVAVTHADRASEKALIDRLTWSAYASTSRYLLEADKPIFSLLLAIEIEDSQGMVGPGEREYLISPTFGSFVMTARNGPPDSVADKKFISSRKPFDWMTEEQFNNLQLLAIHYDWFRDAFDRMARDGRETQWRGLCENEHPELVTLPDPVDYTWTALRKILIVRAVRNDRLIQLSNVFVTNILGKRYTTDQPVESSVLVKQSSATVPVIVLYTRDPDIATSLVANAAVHHHVKVQPFFVTDDSTTSPESQLQVIERLIADAMADGSWLLIQNGHKVPALLESLDNLMERNQRSLPVTSSQFRCWVTAQCSSNEQTTSEATTLPSRILQSWVKVTVDPPKTMKNTLLRAFSSTEITECLKLSSRSDWLAVLHNVCFLHGALRLRASLYGRSGWNKPDRLRNIGMTELYEAIGATACEFQDLVLPNSQEAQQQKNPSWAGVRFFLSEIIYGNYAADSLDHRVLSAMVDNWLSQNAIKKEFTISKLKYKIPSLFFTPQPRLQHIIQSLDSIPNDLLEAPEVCSLHMLPSEASFGTDQYLFTRLNKIIDEMPSSPTLSHDLFIRPPTPFYGPVPSHVSTVCLHKDVLSQGIVASAGQAIMLSKKEVDLGELVSTMLAKVPRLTQKDVEKVKKSGATSFNTFLLRELETMCSLLVEIRTSLQAIKSACEPTSLGDQLNDHDLEIADDLYHVRIPEHWRRLAAGTAMQPGHGLGDWLADLHNRCVHYERIMSLGRDKMPAYWLGAFFHPRGLLSLLVQECCQKQTMTGRSGSLEPCVFQTELTQRDKDHIRDPPAEGMFIFGLYLWGALYDKSSGQLTDLVVNPPEPGNVNQAALMPSRSSFSASTAPMASGPNPLPVIHVKCWARSERPLPPPPDGVPVVSAARAVAAIGLENYSCPVYATRAAGPRQTVLDLELPLGGTPAAHWMTRGLMATVRPF